MRAFIVAVCCISGALYAQVLPPGGATDAPWRPGTAVDVSWDDALDATTVDIELFDAARQQRITVAQQVDAKPRTAGIMLPDSLRPGNHYVVLIRDAAQPSRYVRSSGYIPVAPALARVRPTDVPERHAQRAEYAVAPNPTPASAVLTWDVLGVRKIRITGSDGIVRLERDVEPMDRRLVIPSDRWASGTYVVELLGSTDAIGRILLVAVR